MTTQEIIDELLKQKTKKKIIKKLRRIVRIEK